MDNLKNKLKNWEFRDSIAWKENRCASKSQRTLIDKSYRTFKRSARQLDRKYIETEIENMTQDTFADFLNDKGYSWNDFDHTSDMESLIEEYASTKQLEPPKFLTHPYAQVVCTNKDELNYVLVWANQSGKSVGDHYYSFDQFPIYLSVSDDIIGWTDSGDRIGDKFTFREFKIYAESNK